MQIGERQEARPEIPIAVLRSYTPQIIVISLVAEAKLRAQREVEVASFSEGDVLKGRPRRKRHQLIGVATAEIRIIFMETSDSARGTRAGRGGIRGPHLATPERARDPNG